MHFRSISGARTGLVVDMVWEGLSADGAIEQCGWLKDRYGVSWQVTPGEMGRLIGFPDPVKSARVIKVMLGMVKIDVAGLRRAYDGVA